MYLATLGILIAGFAAQGTPESALPPGSAAPATWCRFVPERVDDFAWENDLVAFRAYGPAIKGLKSGEDSGVDCWGKRVAYPIVDKWYAGEKKRVSYHVDHGEGCDFYKVGSSRGCGGTALWRDGAMVLSGPFTAWKIVSRTPEKSVFELTYDYPAQGEPIREVKRISIELGRQLFLSESTFQKAGKPAAGLEVAVGLTTHGGKARATVTPVAGWMSTWETIEGQEFGTGVVIEPRNVLQMREITSKKRDDGHALLVSRTDATGKVAFWAGFAWAKAGRITTSMQWNEYLGKFTSTSK